MEFTQDRHYQYNYANEMCPTCGQLTLYKKGKNNTKLKSRSLAWNLVMTFAWCLESIRNQ